MACAEFRLALAIEDEAARDHICIEALTLLDRVMHWMVTAEDEDQKESWPLLGQR
ncbi:hypothetical protein [Mesorhizobium sp. A623]